MSLFKRKSERVGDRQPNSEVSGWDSMSDVAFAGQRETVNNSSEKLSSERQQKKIIAAYALGADSYGSIINSNGDSISDDLLNAGMMRLSNGEVPYKDKHDFLVRIMSPISNESNFGNVLNGLNSKHEKRILAAFGQAGFSNFENINVDDIKSFKQEYPTPMDFEETSVAFLNLIEHQNGPQKRREYEQAMESFKKKIYGKQNEYWQQMKYLDKVAGSSKDVNREWRRNETEFALGADINRPSERLTDVRYESERSSEWIPGDTGIYQTSKSQVGEMTPKSVWSGELYADDKCQDAHFENREQQLFGVFDGVGGEKGGRDASLTASGAIREVSSQYNLQTPEDLASALNYASRKISQLESGKSTGVLSRVVERDGRPTLIYATAGDSRLYIVNKQGQAKLLTIDEGVGNRITNFLGNSGDTVSQFGEIPLHEGDKVVLCSDGITGDFAPDLMSEAKLGNIVHRSRNASEAAKNLIIEASKKDDRTAIVFAPKF